MWQTAAGSWASSRRMRTVTGPCRSSHTLEELGADYLAVSNLEEAVQLRRAAVRLPVLLLGYTPPRYAAEMAQMNVHQEIHSLEYAQRLSQRLEGTGLRLPVHWKVDTGMSRLGVSAEDPAKALDELLQIASLPNLAPTGVFTHFSVADSLDPADQAYTQGQFARFQAVCQGLADAGYCDLIRHCANSGATIQYPDYALDTRSAPASRPTASARSPCWRTSCRCARS